MTPKTLTTPSNTSPSTSPTEESGSITSDQADRIISLLEEVNERLIELGLAQLD